MNCDALASEPSHHTKHFQELLSTFQLQNTVNTATRFPTGTSIDVSLVPASLLMDSDVTSPTVDSTDVTPVYGFTDHYQVTLVLSVPSKQHKPDCEPRFKWIRRPALCKISPNALKDSSAQALSALHGVEQLSFNDAASLWHTTVLSVLNKHCPLKKVRLGASSKPKPSPWCTTELQRILQRRQHLHRAVLKNPNDTTLLQRYRDTRREGTLLNRRLKSRFYQSEFYRAHQDPRQQWKLLNGLIGRQRAPESSNISPQAHSLVFATVVHDPDRKPLVLPEEDHNPSDGLCLQEFEPVTPQSVCLGLRHLKRFKAPGSDGLPPSLLQTCSEELSNSLADIFNESLRTGVFPDVYKLAQVTPVFKKNKDRTNPEHYRPVSLLPVSSKMLEQIVLRQILGFFRSSSSDINIPMQQFAYRRHHSTEDLLSLVVSNWQNQLDKGHAVGSLFLDMTKAFDSVNHQRLLTSLYACGIRGTCLQWFTSYLENRQQQVAASTGQRSTVEPCQRGVPQGSVLGPLLFVLYTRLVPECVSSPVQCLMYADDICLTTHGDSVDSVRANLQTALNEVAAHLNELGLRLNASKSQLMFFRKSTRPRPSATEVSVSYQNVSIPYVAKTRYLGLELDELLTFNDHVDMLCAKINQKLAAYRRVRCQLDVKARRLFYFGLIQSSLEYASNAYVHSLTQNVYNKLVKCYKRSLRITFGHFHDTPSAQICQHYQICPIQTRYAVKLHCLVFRCLNSLASSMLSSLFNPVSSISARCTTRGASTKSLILPHAETRSGLFSLAFLAADRFNSLPADVRIAKSLPKFRSLCFASLGYHVKRPWSV